MSNKNNKYLVQGSILGIASIISRFIGMLYRIPLTRIIGVDGIGTYSTAYEWYNIALLLSSYSIPLAVSKLVSAREMNKEYRNSYHIFKTAMVISASVGALMFAVVYFGASIWAKLSDYESIEMPLRVLAPAIFVMSIMGVLRGLFQGKRTMIPTALSQLLEQIVNAGVSVAAAYVLMKQHNASPDITTYGATGSTLGTLFGAIFGLMFLVLIFMVNRPILKKRAAKDTTNHQESFGEAARAIIFTAVPIIISQTAFQISGLIDTKLWGMYAESQGMEETVKNTVYGIYSGQYRLLTNVPIAIATALGTSVVPTLAAYYSKGKKEEVRSKVANTMKFNMLIAFPSAIGLGVLAKPIITMLFGYSGDVNMSANALRVGCIAVVLFALSTLTNGVLQGIDKMRVPVRHAFISLIIHIPLVLFMLFVLKVGIFGLVYGNITFAFVICVLNWVSIKKYLNYKQEVVRTFVLPCIAAIIMGVAAFFTYQLVYSLIATNTLSVLITMIIAIAVYGISIILLKAVNEEELLEMPKGYLLLRICRKLHLMK